MSDKYKKTTATPITMITITVARLEMLAVTHNTDYVRGSEVVSSTQLSKYSVGIFCVCVKACSWSESGSLLAMRLNVTCTVTPCYHG